MATLVLSYAGSALGGLIGGPLGAAIGRAAGAIAGNLIDQRLFGGGTRRAEGPRLNDLRIMASTEGAAIPRVWGRARLAGQVIWATNFEEVISTQTEKSGAKGGGGGAKTKVTTYSYFANFAVALAEGPVAGIGRIWADGKPFDPDGVTWRLHRGHESQAPDSLITAKEGAGNAPAYRGLAYVVFERLPLEQFGNRLPQLSFEVIRPVSRAAKAVKAVNIIPGATEFGYDPDVVTRHPGEGVTEPENAHAEAGRSDWTVSLDTLQAVCPNLSSASLVVAWFGTSLDCASCALKPGVEVPLKETRPHEWRVAGIARGSAHVVSSVDGGPAYGGTPSDASVIRAIADLKARGLKISFYPFILMDVPAGNTLIDPYTGATGQPAYPWRGRITCNPAPGQAGSPDKTATLDTGLSAFIGAAQPSHFSVSGTEVIYAGPPEWSYRRMILHYAHLCAAAGGVDTFLIGSELRGLTTLRNAPGQFPFVEALRTLAAEVATILPGAEISYAADWSEYFGHQPQDGSGDVYFHLDRLWSSPDIDFVGIDNYMPLSDWRDGPDHLDRVAGHESIYDLDYLKANISGSEGFDWYYASAAARQAQSRTAITDGTHGKPWVFRYKDLVSWWSNPHVNRPGGIEAGPPTGWVPRSKPIRFTEAGCPAVDKGTNQPNVFVDPKSSETALPHHSSGASDGFILHRLVEALDDYWSTTGPHNPLSPVYGGPMVEAGDIHYWAWDARPYPAFPALTSVWSDGANHPRGHWLNGRIEAAPMDDLIEDICRTFGFEDAETSGLAGLVDGVVLDRIGSARDAIEPIARAFSFDAVETDGAMLFRTRDRLPALALAREDLVDEEDGPLFTLTRAQETELPQRLKLAYAEPALDYRSAVVEAFRAGTPSARETGLELPCAIAQDEATRRAETLLQEIWAGRESISFTLAPSRLAVLPGDVLTVDIKLSTLIIMIEDVTDADRRRVKGRVHDVSLYQRREAPSRRLALAAPALAGAPAVAVLDLPLAGENRRAEASWIACFSKPWPGSLNLFRKSGDGGFVLERTLEAPATMGRLLAPLPRGPVALFDRANAVEVKLLAGALVSVSESEMLGGANVLAIGSEASGWEIVQFRDVELTGPLTYTLTHLLRGQSGSEPEMSDPQPAGARVVLLDPAVVQMNETLDDFGAGITWRVGPSNRDHGDPSYVEFTHQAKALGLRPWTPAHLKAERDGDDVVFTWIRRTRIGGDGWAVSEVPLSEESETYALDIMSGTAVARSETLSTPLYRYTAAAQIADFGGLQSAFTLRVAQLGAQYGRGAILERTINA